MNHQCYAYDCVSSTVGYCLCSGVPTLFCLIHSHEHTKLNRDHRIIDIDASPLSETHRNLYKISQFKIILNNTKKSLLNESIKFVKLAKTLNQDCQNKIDKLIKDCDHMILSLALPDENTVKINQDSIISKLGSDLTKNNLKE